MSDELRFERLYDAPPEVVFDAFVDPDTQPELHGAGHAGWTVHSCETDVRVGGTSTYVMGVEGQEPDTETRVFSVVDRPNRLVFRHSMRFAESGETIETELTVTFEEQDGKTLLRIESADGTDTFRGGWPFYLVVLQGVVASGVAARG